MTTFLPGRARTSVAVTIPTGFPVPATRFLQESADGVGAAVLANFAALAIR